MILPADVVEFTPEHRAWCRQQNCDPACHACGTEIAVGDRAGWREAARFGKNRVRVMMCARCCIDNRPIGLAELRYLADLCLRPAAPPKAAMPGASAGSGRTAEPPIVSVERPWSRMLTKPGQAACTVERAYPVRLPGALRRTLLCYTDAVRTDIDPWRGLPRPFRSA